MKEVTLVITSCGRFSFLKSTIESFFKYNTYPIKKVIIIDNSNTENSSTIITEIINKFSQNYEVIINEQNIGQVASIDKAYNLVETEFIYHCEDDWEFFDYGFVEKSMDVLVSNNSVVNVNTRIRFDGEKGSMHPVYGDFITENGTKYKLYEYGYLGAWHGFSWNPGLRKKSDYELIKPFSKYGNEERVGNEYFNLGFKSACLENFYNKHLGTHSFTEKSNQ
jgi:hypothetical protein